MATDERREKIGPYEVQGVLGKGSRVYKAKDPSSGRTVAVKLLPPELGQDGAEVARFAEEVDAVAGLHHPNVVRILDRGEADGDHYLVMELVEGSALEVVMRRRRLSLQEALLVFESVCQGLRAAHAAGILHRDLNPGNVLVSDDLRVIKLSGFGLGKAESTSRSIGTLTTGQVNLGALHYMAPEQAAGTGEVDERCDIYSAGVLFYEMLTGRVPVGRFSLPSQLNNELPPEVDTVVLKCLETAPLDRWPNLEQLLAALHQLEDRLRLGLMKELRGIGSSTSKILLRSRGGLLGGPKAKIVLAVVLAVLVIAALAAILLRGPGSAPQEPLEPAVVAGAEDGAPAAGEGAGDVAEGDDAGEAEPDPLEAVEEADAGAPEEPAPVTETPPAQPPAGGATPPAPRAQQPAARPEATAEAPAEASAEPDAAAEARAAQAAEDLRVAMDKFTAGLYEPAIADLEGFIRRYSNHERVPEAYLTIGMAYEQQGRTQQAQASYVELQSRYPRALQAVEARYRQAMLVSEQRNRGIEARELFAGLVRDHPDSVFAPRALAAKADIEKGLKLEEGDAQLGRVPAALRTWQALIERYPMDMAVERGLQEMATIYGDLRQYERAAETWSELGRRFPGGSHDAWWEAGQLFERRLNDRARAIAAYRNVPESSSHHRDAQRRIQRLN